MNPVKLIPLPELTECTIIERTSRFTINAIVNNKVETIYLNNTGRLEGILTSGSTGYCIPNKSGRLKYRIIGVRREDYGILVDTSLQEKGFLEAQKAGLIPWLLNCVFKRRNIRLLGSVIDFLFECNNHEVLVEVKSAVMELPGGYAGYPDAPTVRGRLQIETLTKHVENGGRAIVVFIAGTPWARGFKLYCDIDSLIKNYVEKAVKAGVEFKAVNIFLDYRGKSIVLGTSNLHVDLTCS